MKITQAQLAKSRVLVVGDAMIDRYWYGAVDRISPEAPVPVVRVTSEQDRLGGAANVALNVTTLGARATLLSMVGCDDAARSLRRLLAEKGVDAVLGEDPQLQTIVKLRVIGRSQQLLRVDFEREPAHEVLAQMLSDFEQALPHHDVVLFSDYGKGGLAHIPRMIELARQAGKPVLVDFTADNCANCKFNKARSLNIAPTIDRLKAGDFVTLEGDFTDADPEIAAELKRFKRRGVPLVLVYSKDGSKSPREMPTIFSPEEIHAALDWAVK